MVEKSLCVPIFSSFSLFSLVPYLLNAALGSEDLAWRASRVCTLFQQFAPYAEISYSAPRPNRFDVRSRQSRRYNLWYRLTPFARAVAIWQFVAEPLQISSSINDQKKRKT